MFKESHTRLAFGERVQRHVLEFLHQRPGVGSGKRRSGCQCGRQFPRRSKRANSSLNAPAKQDVLQGVAVNEQICLAHICVHADVENEKE